MIQHESSPGAEFEKRLKLALEHFGYTVKQGHTIGQRPDGGTHKVDLYVTTAPIASSGAGIQPKPNTSPLHSLPILVSAKWQSARGTAEQKIPWEVICLTTAMATGNYRKAYLVLGGTGWTLKKFYLQDGLKPHLNDATKVKIIDDVQFYSLVQTKGL